MRHWSGGLANSCWLLPPGSTPAPEAIEAVKEAGAAARYRSVAVLRKRRLRTSTLHKVCRRKGSHEAGNLSLVRIVQIRECSICPDHSVWGELVTDAQISGIAENVSNRRNHREVSLLRPASNRSGPCQKRLVKHAGAFLKAVSGGERYVRAEAVLQIDRRVLVRLIH